VQATPNDIAVFLEHVGDGVSVQDANGRLVYANTAAARGLGFASAAELLATPLPEIMTRFAVLAEDGSPFPLDQLPGRRALRGEPEQAVTIRFRIHDTGEERWSVVRSSPVFDATGNVRFAVNVWQDATAQKRDEDAQRFLAEAGEALAASLDIEATLSRIAHLAVPRLADWCAVHLVRPDGQVSQLAVAHVDPERVEWALKLQEQYPADPAADQGISRVVRTGQPELIPEVTDEMLAAIAHNPEHLSMLRRVGLSSGIIVPMMTRTGAVGAITFVAAESGRRFDARDLDLTQELAHRAALAIENARLYDAERAARVHAEAVEVRFRTLFEGVPDAILVLDATGNIVEANEAASHLLGYEPTELLTLHLRDLSPEPETPPALFASFEEDEEHRAEIALRRRDGAAVTVESWSRRLDLPTGPIGIAVVRDITERIAGDQIREEVLTAISHDLRNPLGSIKLHAQTLQRALRRGGSVDPQRLDDGLTAITTMSTRVASLLEDIVDVARDRGPGAIPFDPEPTDLVALAHRCAEEVRTAAGHDIQVGAALETLVGMWDSRGIERVLLNLLNNAVKYSPGGGAVTVRVDLEAEADEPTARVVVADEGIGIPAADLARIFERYRRGRNVGQIAGTGMGLTGARQIVDRHGGAIAIASAEGHGTRITVRLPLEPGGGVTGRTGPVTPSPRLTPTP
jgi:PAS domain S-box-containing protein